MCEVCVLAPVSTNIPLALAITYPYSLPADEAQREDERGAGREKIGENEGVGAKSVKTTDEKKINIYNLKTVEQRKIIHSFYLILCCFVLPFAFYSIFVFIVGVCLPFGILCCLCMCVCMCILLSPPLLRRLSLASCRALDADFDI